MIHKCGARSLNFGLSLHLDPNFVYESSEGTGESYAGESAHLPEHSLLDNAISSQISYVDSFTVLPA